ncbi:MAG: alpha/beta hydrolase [Burkholderiaceae bacterium]
MRLSIALLTLLLLAACGREPAITAADLTPCRLKGIEREARCGHVTMPQNPDDPAGPSIEVHFAVLSALARHPWPDPVFVFAGGPGQAGTQIAAPVSAVLAPLNHRRDLVFIDSRGTGQSAAFHCQDESDTLSAFDPGRQAQRLAQCAKTAPIDPSQLATWIAVRDIDAVRARLGAEKINLWGGSYGTRAELEYLRQFPQRVRSAVLDGVAPPDMRLPVAIALDAEAALDALVKACAADADCARRYPRLADSIEQLLARAGFGKTIAVADPLTGQTETVTLSRELAAAWLRLPLYAPHLAAALPHAITQAAAGHYEPLAALVTGMSGAVADNFAVGMHYSVVCSEDLPRITASDRAQANATRLGAAVLKTYDAACAALPRRTVPAEFYEVGASPVPVLLLSGGLDPATPPRHAAAMAERLGHARHLIAPMLGHGISGQGCAPDLIARFIKQASLAGIDGDCLTRIPAPLFFNPPARP